jgi:hypothetical protein
VISANITNEEIDTLKKNYNTNSIGFLSLILGYKYGLLTQDLTDTEARFVKRGFLNRYIEKEEQENV